MCVRGFSLFLRSLSPSSVLPPVPLSLPPDDAASSLARRCIPCLTFPRRPRASLHTPLREKNPATRDGVYTGRAYIDVGTRCGDVEGNPAHLHSTIRAYGTCAPAQHMYGDIYLSSCESYLSIHPIPLDRCIYILYIYIYRTYRLRDDKFQRYTLINFLLFRRRSNCFVVVHAEMWHAI